MEDHFILFPIMIIVWLCYGIWYAIKLLWFLCGAIGILISKLYKNINKNAVKDKIKSDNEIDVNDYIKR